MEGTVTVGRNYVIFIFFNKTDSGQNMYTVFFMGEEYIHSNNEVVVKAIVLGEVNQTPAELYPLTRKF